jgi:CheY-like chemotaxis protein
VVEDENVARGWITHLLCGSGYETIEASCAEEALEIFNSEKNRINMVLTDVVLPGKDGVELIDELRAINPQLRVLLSSGYANEKHRLEAVLKEGAGFIQKPYTRVELLRKMREVLTAGQEEDLET